jgi:2-(1,2-epoxy-1,2-dihydrophenyl)acetyl-CoA isomerase
MYETILFAVDAGVATVTLNRPTAGNALNRQMGAELLDATLKIAYDRSVRAVVLAANGKVFCGGGDLASFAGAGDEAAPLIDALTVDFHAALARLTRIDAPVVAAVTGTCGGAGMSMVAACDLVVAARSAKFTMGYTKAGLSPDGTSSFFLARVVGLRRATELVLTNRLLKAEEAESWGLVNQVVDDAVVLSTANALAAGFATGPTRAFGAAKRLLIAGASSSLEEAMERESAQIAALTRTFDAREGMASFLEKRPAAFRGE